jgi:hypothetical protein
MSKPYFIPQTSPEGFSAAILSTGYRNPLEERSEIEELLAEMEVTGPILVDMILANASASNRFLVLEMGQDRFTGTGTAVESTPELVSYARKAYRTYEHPLDKCLLHSKELRALLK